MVDTCNYIHGYTDEEQSRLLSQSEHWKSLVTLVDFPLEPGERLLDIGCAVGANLRMFARNVPGLLLAGIDREAKQIEAARQNLAFLPAEQVDLRVGRGESLPWADASFDRVFIMWLFEHVTDPAPILSEAWRVLRPGGRLSVIETDYDTYLSLPESEATQTLYRAFREHFVRFGNHQPGRKLGLWLAAAGFQVVEHRAFPIHFSTAADPNGLQRHLDYTADYLEPAIESLAALGFDQSLLRQGSKELRELSRHPDGDFLQLVFRATGRKPE